MFEVTQGHLACIDSIYSFPGRFWETSLSQSRRASPLLAPPSHSANSFLLKLPFLSAQGSVRPQFSTLVGSCVLLASHPVDSTHSREPWTMLPLVPAIGERILPLAWEEGSWSELVQQVSAQSEQGLCLYLDFTHGIICPDGLSPNSSGETMADHTATLYPHLSYQARRVCLPKALQVHFVPEMNCRV